MFGSSHSGPMYHTVSAAAHCNDWIMPCWSASSEYNFQAALTKKIHCSKLDSSLAGWSTPENWLSFCGFMEWPQAGGAGFTSNWFQLIPTPGHSHKIASNYPWNWCCCLMTLGHLDCPLLFYLCITVFHHLLHQGLLSILSLVLKFLCSFPLRSLYSCLSLLIWTKLCLSEMVHETVMGISCQHTIFSRFRAMEVTISSDVNSNKHSHSFNILTANGNVIACKWQIPQRCYSVNNSDGRGISPCLLHTHKNWKIMDCATTRMVRTTIFPCALPTDTKIARAMQIHSQ